jgi:plastocyanin
MRRYLVLMVPLALVLALPIACARSESTPAAALAPSPVNASAHTGTPTTAASAALPDRIVTVTDACDPETFNAAVGPGACVRSGGVTFQNFLALLTRNQFVGAWTFAPPNTSAAVGQALVATNRGGETHTFTEVANFGGGIVPVLNQLSGNTTVAPECTALAPGDFIPAGGTHRETLHDTGTVKFQCCIHPWMRLEAKVSAR